MKALSEFLIGLFEALGMYSTSNGLGEHLRGLDMACADYTRQSTYNLVFLSLFIINSLIIFNYYYGILNRSGWNNVGKWLLNVLIGAVIIFIIAFVYTNNDLKAGNICNQLRVGVSDCAGFATTAFIYSIIWSILFSILIKWKSSVNRKVPF
ncbi:hypothetical protein ACFSPU_10790 [Haoranjiania flava]|uniref:Uncharacterized protein n=1 Tax=Haoranjiania flava TaxID=1856322 RepID=A0AAE3LK72_9BACT|nr:hypothetical protein [Haoranjiania flava]MCU7694303.1 hypothetical protein [Haoranjiania flava]